MSWAELELIELVEAELPTLNIIQSTPFILCAGLLKANVCVYKRMIEAARICFN